MRVFTQRCKETPAYSHHRYIFAFAMPADPTRDLNNFLQSHRDGGGNLTRYFSWLSQQEGPDHQRIHHATAKLRGQVIGYGRGFSIGNAKQVAASQALQYLNSLPAKHPLLSAR